MLGTDGAEERDASGERCRWGTVRKLAGLPSPSRTEQKTRREITQVTSKERYSLGEHHSLRITEHYSSILNLGKVMQ